ncbi:MAG: fused MFS/spermidine synthase [Akkermansiaceae bacterium]|nr:fused MFS/spermidine synthase [Akkermansiaceae bacterium]MDP4779226.1 fused MFS/spermidine synthase [Akkermansiaceae bacterium]MDP4995217.1 fused MFS/spermidine synthase [Akkermansiaceae bacterium]
MKKPAALRPWFASLSIILLISGICSLVYQVVWIREFRVIFGGTTGAMAAVLAVFMGGLGFGGALLGRRVEVSSRPLKFYAFVECGIALSAAITPLLLVWVRSLYFTTGGETSLGYPLATLLRIGMTLVVIGLPCFLMGGTLPAAVKYIQDDEDRERQSAGWFYGINIFGAVAGVVLSTFLLLEVLGARGALWLAAGLNLGIAYWALALARSRSVSETVEPNQKIATAPDASPDFSEEVSVKAEMKLPVPSRWSYGAAFSTGFVFFVLELVWYRVSTPLTGGSVYSLGMVLVVALLGMAIGGIVYSKFGRRIGQRPGVFAILCFLQCLAVFLPYFAGDWLAWVVAMGVGKVQNAPFENVLFLWFLVTSALLLLPSILAGLQFPMILSFLGQGGTGVGRQIGRAYAWNTFGAILGSILGGFVFIPYHGALNTWLLCGLLCGGLAVAFAWLSRRSNTQPRFLGFLIPDLVIVGVLITSFTGIFLTKGPGAYWLYSGIGLGRSESLPPSLEDCAKSFAEHDSFVEKSWDGREASVAVFTTYSPAIYTNSIAESAIHGDAATLIGSSILPALLHKDKVKTAAVIGMGTGVSAGWLAALPMVEKVDVLEIEPAVVKAQTSFSDANLNYLENPKVRVIVGDARETLATRGDSYDVIISEPSNLFRAGTCDFYTEGYYRQCAERMNPNGLFVQWIQGYSIDSESILIAANTLQGVFPYVELWMTMPGDFLLIGSATEFTYDIESVRTRIGRPVIRDGLARGFMTKSVEGVFARFLADTEMLKNLTAGISVVNTNDRNFLEFRTARSALQTNDTSVLNLYRHLRSSLDQSRFDNSQLDRELFVEEQTIMGFNLSLKNLDPQAPAWMNKALGQFFDGNISGLEQNWIGTPRSLRGAFLMACSKASGPADASFEIDRIRKEFPGDAAVLTALNSFWKNRPAQATEELALAIRKLEEEKWTFFETAWIYYGTHERFLGSLDQDQKEKILSLLEKPLPSRPYEIRRKDLLLKFSK